eukprot:TRINITY_DN3316_c1_g1_i11.p1 TRINITY_DN3316_c1_g1~~TRINITY_DN3316_c1_g1_i11.p1  ORF type:complete len:590 (-),score=132.61 TRINITY_DN3316_c1_g1_i11:369-2138(-)
MVDDLKKYQDSLLKTFNNFQEFQEFLKKVDFNSIFESLSKYNSSILELAEELKIGFGSIGKVQTETFVLYFRILWFFGSFEESSKNWNDCKFQENLDYFSECCETAKETIRNILISNLFGKAEIESDDLENLSCLHNKFDDLNKELTGIFCRLSISISTLPDDISASIKTHTDKIGEILYSKQNSQRTKDLPCLDFELLSTSKVLGEGHFGKVYLGQYQYADVAVKIMNDSTKEQVTDECIRAKFRHRFICNVYGITCKNLSGTNWGIVMEYCPYTLRGKMHEMNVLEKLISMIQLGFALEFYHINGVIHLDVKPDNVLIRIDGTVALCDFGHVHSFVRNSRLSNGGTICYMPPELTKNVIFAHPGIDCWAFATTYFEVMTMIKPFQGISNCLTIPIKLVNKELPFKSEELELAIGYKFMSRCFKFDPDERPMFSEIVEYLDGLIADLKKCVSLLVCDYFKKHNLDENNEEEKKRLESAICDSYVKHRLYEVIVPDNFSEYCNTDTIYHSVRDGKLEIVKQWIKAGNEGETVLWEASSCGHSDIVEILLDFEVDINFCKNVGSSLLYISFHCSYLVVDKMLLDYGADVF